MLSCPFSLERSTDAPPIRLPSLESKTHVGGLVLKSSIWIDGRKIMDEGKHLID